MEENVPDHSAIQDLIPEEREAGVDLENVTSLAKQPKEAMKNQTTQTLDLEAVHGGKIEKDLDTIAKEDPMNPPKEHIIVHWFWKSLRLIQPGKVLYPFLHV